MHRCRQSRIYTNYPIGIYRCFVLTNILELPDSEESRTKRIVNAFLNIVTLHPDFAAMLLCITTRREQAANLCDWGVRTLPQVALSGYDFRRIVAKVIIFSRLTIKGKVKEL